MKSARSQAAHPSKSTGYGNIEVGSTWLGIGTDNSAYSGTFNGNGHTVTLTGAGENNKKLFVTTSATAKLNAICVQGGYLTYTDSAAVTSCYRPENAALFNTKAAGSAANCYTLGSLMEQAGGSVTFTNCFVDASSGNGTTAGIKSMDKTAFTSGEVAYALAQGDTHWGQTLTASKDVYPIYNGEHVYYSEKAPGKYHNHAGDGCEYCSIEPDKDADDVYNILTAADLKWFALYVNGEATNRPGMHPNAKAKLGADITLNENVLNENGELNTTNTNSFEVWTPIGTSDANSFTGVFDGQGHTICGLYVSASNEYMGLFGYIGTGGTVKNVKIEDSYFSTSSTASFYIGAICGCNGGTVEGCTVNACIIGGNTTSVSYTGGICGWNNGTVSGCETHGKVSGVNCVGGICGYNCGMNAEKAIVQNCHNSGEVKGDTSIGGVCGGNSNGTVQGCYNAGGVNATGDRAGGVCGSNEGGTVQDCYNTGIVKATGYAVSGVCGYNYGGTVQDCYNTGAASTSGDYVGGVCGAQASGTVMRCYNTGAVTVNEHVGGICGSWISGTFNDCYYLDTLNVSGFGEANSTATNCIMKTVVEFRSGEVANLLQTAAGSTATWGQTIGVNQSPVLAWQTDYQKVYPTAEDSLCPGYSNTQDEHREHHYENGACIYCGAHQPTQVAYTVTIPATVQLGNEANITATGVVLPDGKQLNVMMGSSNSEFTVTLEGDTSENPDSATYAVNNGNVKPGSTVLTVSENTESASTDLTFSVPTSTTYSGKYTGTVTFTVSVDDKAS